MENDTTVMSIAEVLDRHSDAVDAQLRECLAPLIKEGRSYHRDIGRLYDIVAEFALRKGKRLASCSTLVAYEGYAGKIDERILRVGCGIELYRHSILIHDDLVDADESRRGGKTVHKLLAEGYDERFGVGSAIFAGNILYSLALRSILSSGFPSDKLTPVVEMLAREYGRVNESQVLDLMFEYKSPDVSEWKTMASKRAASLFKATIVAGALLGGAPGEDLSLLEEAGKHIGYAFDIQDDIIDTFAKEDEYGRRLGGDVLRGKKPLHIILALEKDKRTAAALESARHGELSKEIEQVRRLVVGSGALAEAKKISKEHADAAAKAVVETHMSDSSKRFFTSFIDYIKGSLDWYK
ncbi:MAG: polyprenyl synthetase family protein [Thermoplasmata archaeon]